MLVYLPVVQEYCRFREGYNIENIRGVSERGEGGSEGEGVI